MAHTVIVEFLCATGKGDEFLSLLLAALPDTRAYEGCQLVETYVDRDNPDLIVLWEKWADRSNHESYMAWRTKTGLLDVIGPFLIDAPRFLHLTAAN